MLFSVLALVACNSAKTEEELALEALEHDNEIRQNTIDSLAAIKMETHNHNTTNSSTTNNTSTSSTETTEKKGMSNKTKGALIGTGVGVVGGVVTGAAVSKDKKKGAVVGGVVGGAVGSGVGYGIGAQKDKKESEE